MNMSDFTDDIWADESDYKPRQPRRHPMADKRQSIKTPEFRGNFVYLAKARKTTGDDGKEKEAYEISIVLPKNTPSTKAFIAECKKMILACYIAKHGQPKDGKLRMKHYPIKDGDETEVDTFQGCYVIGAKSNFRPSCIDAHGDEISTTDDLYSGAWYKCKISAWGWNNPKSGKGISINLESVIKTRDDKKIGGGSNAADDFADDISEGGSDGDGGDADDDISDLLK
jgi:hypothetical protein